MAIKFKCIIKKKMTDVTDMKIVRLFSRQRLSATVIISKDKDFRIVGGTPSSTPTSTPIPSPPGSRSRASSYDLKCYHQLAKEFEASGGVYMTDITDQNNVTNN